MSTAGDSLRALLLELFPTGWKHQFGRWLDSDVKTYRYIVVRPVGGVNAGLLRQPAFVVAVVGADGDQSLFVHGVAEQIVSAIRGATGELPFFQAGEPVFMATSDNRTVFEIAVSTITD
jgi:hypothetical protein